MLLYVQIIELIFQFLLELLSISLVLPMEYSAA